MMKRFLPALVVLLIGGMYVHGIPSVVRNSIQDVEPVGPVRVSVFLWDIYDIYLYAPGGQYSPEKPFALRLRYLRHLKGQHIAERSISEMRKEGISETKLAAWYGQLRSIFPDVDVGQELIGLFVPGQPTLFYDGESLIGTVRDPEFPGPFSRIWLGESSPLPKVRAALIQAKE